MVTIKDIAKLAGVSHGTVSNVLNHRGNVSSEKIKIVEETAKKLGYQLNIQAQSLRKGSSTRVCIFIPFNLRATYKEFYAGIYNTLLDSKYDLELIYVQDVLDCKDQLEKELATKPVAALFLGFLPEEHVLEFAPQEISLIVIDYYQEILNPKVITLNFDIEQIEKDLKEYLELHRLENILVISHKQKQSGVFASRLTNRLADTYHISNYALEQEHSILRLFQQMNNIQHFDLIICMEYEIKSELLKIFHWFESEQIPNILTFDSKQFFRDTNDYYELDYKKLGFEIGEKIIQKQLKRMKPQVITPNGIIQPIQIGVVDEAKEIKILSLKSPTSAAIKMVSNKFSTETSIKVMVDELDAKDLYYKLLNQEEVIEEYDLIRVDVSSLPQVAADLFIALDQEPIITEILNNIEEEVLEEYIKVNQSIYALPFDVSVQMLFYRLDLFEDKWIQRRFYEKYKENLAVPKTFAEFDKISQFFSDSKNSLGKVTYGHSLANNTPVVATCDLMPRYREQLKMTHDEQLAFDLALEQYVTSCASTDCKEDKWWGTLADEFATGETAMAIIFSSYASRITNRIHECHDFEMGVADVPGQQPLIGGGSLGITKGCKNIKNVLSYLEWLYSDEISQLVVCLGGIILNKKVISNRNLQELFPWLSQIESSIKLGNRLNFEGYKYAKEYEEELGLSIINYVKNW